MLYMCALSHTPYAYGRIFKSVLVKQRGNKMGTEINHISYEQVDHKKSFSERHVLPGIAVALANGGKEFYHSETREVHPITAIQNAGKWLLNSVGIKHY